MNNFTFNLMMRNDKFKSHADTKWSEISTQKEVGYFGEKKVVHVVSNISHLKVNHAGMEVSMLVPEGHEVYQAIRENVTFMQNAEKRQETIGHVVGLVKDGEVVEEHFMNAQEGKVYGMKK